ncbi:MAG: hypothetical protein IPL61_16260 [Myxococcales bacterium]|nr:hypothetical protein [Myxococcales bacterium]
MRLRLICSSAAALVAATALVAVARPGRSVRVPRTTTALTTMARFCAVHEDDRGMCFAPVAVGDAGAVLSPDGDNLGETTITEVTPNPNRCGVAETWSIRFDRGRLGGRYLDYGGTILIGARAAPEAKLMPGAAGVPDDNPLASVMYVVDTDGDDRADLLVDQFACDQARRPTRVNYPSHMCTEYWLAIRDHWQRARTDQIAICSR